MSPPINFLRLYRKRSPLTQSDIACLLGLPDDSNISRYEKGQREPGIEFLLVYHLLFDATIESFFEYQSTEIKAILLKRIESLNIELRKEPNSAKHIPKIKFLEQVISRLTK